MLPDSGRSTKTPEPYATLTYRPDAGSVRLAQFKPSLDVMYVFSVVVYVLPESVYPLRSVETKRPFPNAMSVTGPR